MMKKVLLGLLLATTAMGAARIKNADIASDAAIVDTKLNTISTAGKVSNSATTAASTNTASAIVARNASGAFYASTISADLVGNVTGNATTATTATLANTATALAANPADCASNRYAISSDAQGNFGCDQVSLSAGVTGTLPVSNGGTGNSSLTAYRILLSGTTSTGAIQVMSSEGTAGQVLTSGGPNTLPTFTTISTGGSGPGVHEVRLDTTNGHGSSSTMIPRFTNTVTNTGTSITYSGDSSTLGTVLTINTTGYYCGTWWTGGFTSGGFIGWSVNSAALTTEVYSITSSTRYAVNGCGVNEACIATFCANLNASDVVRPHSNGNAFDANNARAGLIINRVF